MLKAIIYDFDGVIGDSVGLSFESYVYALSKLGIKASKQEIIDKCFNKANAIGARNFNADPEVFSKLSHSIVEKGYKRIDLQPGVKDTFKEIAEKNLLIGIGTLKHAKYKKWIEQVLDRTGASKFIDVLVTRDDILKEKPAIFLEVYRRLKVKPEEVLLVGDADTDIIAAKKLNATSVLFFPKKHEEFYSLEELKKAKPDFIIEKHEEILDIITKLVH